MNGVEAIRRLHQHRAWANAKLIQSAQALKSADLQTPLPIGQGSIWKSLLHMYAAEYVWLESLARVDPCGSRARPRLAALPRACGLAGACNRVAHNV